MEAQKRKLSEDDPDYEGVPDSSHERAKVRKLENEGKKCTTSKSGRVGSKQLSMEIGTGNQEQVLKLVFVILKRKMQRFSSIKFLDTAYGK